jgi:hypothetical protein
MFDVPAQLPPPPRDFVNRVGELVALDELTSRSKDLQASVVVLCGLSGVGKTAMSRHWAHVNRDRFVDGQLYADLGRGGVETCDLLGSFLLALGVPDDRLPVTLGERAALFRSRTAGKRLLLLLDDVEHAEQVTPLIPAAPDSVVLVTSRGSLDELAGGGAGLIRLAPLDEHSAQGLLVAMLGARRAETEPAAFEELVRISAGLPLALQVSGAQLANRPHMTVSQLVGQLAQEAQQERTPVGSATPVDLVFTGAYRALSPPAAQLYRRLGAHPGPSFTSDVALAAAGWSSPAVGDPLHELHTAYLVEDRGQWSRFYEPLLLHARGALALEEPQREREAAVGRIVTYYARAAQRMSHTLDPDATEGATSQSSADALAWIDVERSNLLAAMEVATEHRWDRQASSIGEALAPAYRMHEHLHEAWAVCAVAAVAAHRSGDAAAEERIRGQLVRLSEEHASSREELDGVLARIDRLGPSALLKSLAAARPQVVTVPYAASGGSSALLRMADGATLRAEAHRESFALVWPAHCSLSQLVDLIVRPVDLLPDAGTSVLFADSEGAVREEACGDAQELIASGADDVAFARLELADLVVTWNRRADPRISGAEGWAHEVGLGAEQFDARFLCDLLERTAVESLASAAPQLLDEARGVLTSTAIGRLRGAEGPGKEDAS